MPWRGPVGRSFNCDIGFGSEPFIDNILYHAEADPDDLGHESELRQQCRVNSVQKS